MQGTTAYVNCFQDTLVSRLLANAFHNPIHGTFCMCIDQASMLRCEKRGIPDMYECINSCNCVFFAQEHEHDKLTKDDLVVNIVQSEAGCRDN